MGVGDPTDAINGAIDLWLREQARLPRDCDPVSARGYQWKSLFLPDGTEPGEGWNLPERRTFRFRLEDVAFDQARLLARIKKNPCLLYCGTHDHESACQDANENL